MRRALAIALVLGATPCWAAETPLRLKTPPPLSKDMESLPRITAPRTPQTHKINAALARADARGLKAAAECRKADPKYGFWERGVLLRMGGPRFLSVWVADFFGCGGAHPNTAQQALTYDLSTGEPINWAHYLPSSLVMDTAIIDGSDGARLGVVRSPQLVERYRRDALSRLDPQDVDEGCDYFYKRDDISLVLWIDATHEGVAMQDAEGQGPCLMSIVIPVAELRELGASQRLVDAIETAHRTHAWDKAYD